MTLQEINDICVAKMSEALVEVEVPDEFWHDVYELTKDNEDRELKELQMPKKPINETGYYRDNKCPSCLKPIKSGKGSSSHYRNNWCNNCGQRIDWNE